LEAVELALRASLHTVGATALSALLQFDAPNLEQRQLPCPCGHTACYLELRSKTVLTAVGPATILRPYYLCDQCHCGQFPVDVELDVEITELSPGVRQMMAAVGHEAAFEQGRQQKELLAGLSVTTKAVERTAEAIGEDIEVRQQRELERALQLALPIPLGPRIPNLYMEMDGTGIPVVKKETKGRAGKQDGQPAHTREAKLAAYSHRPPSMNKAIRYGMTPPPAMWAPSRAVSHSVAVSMQKLGSGGRHGRTRPSCWETEPNGSGIRPISTSREPSRSSISFMPASTCGI
jgi:hypothetical protein